ncbi:hypothetical protein [Streptomyces sp. NPDC002520]
MDDVERRGNAAWAAIAPLSGDQLARLRAVGSEHPAASGDIHFSAGDASYDFATAVGEGSAAVRLVFERRRTDGLEIP